MKKVAIIQKCPSKNKYDNHFQFEFDLYNLCSVYKEKVLKKDVDIEINVDDYDFIILVGSEASKHFAKVTSVTNFAGVLVDDKYLCISNPAMLVFKPEGKADFERAVQKIHSYISGTLTNASETGDFKGIDDD